MLGPSASHALAGGSYFFGLITPTPMVHLLLPGVASEAQLIRELQAQGFTAIKVTPLYPNMGDPRPELMHPDLTVGSPDDSRAQQTPVHPGWNGTADKDGTTYEVYVDVAAH